MKAPMIPGQNMSGMNTATVVAVDPMIGQATSPIPFLAARIGDWPSLIKRCVFSITTMPLSTNMPNASTRLKSTIMFNVMPMMLSTAKLSIMLNGMATPTKMALRNPRKNISTPTTSRIPKMMLFSSSSTCVRVWSLMSPVMLTFRSRGKTWALKWSSRCGDAVAGHQQVPAAPLHHIHHHHRLAVLTGIAVRFLVGEFDIRDLTQDEPVPGSPASRSRNAPGPCR